MPSHLKTILDKSEQHMHKLLGSDMKKCTSVLQKCRKQLSELMDSRRAHQLAWIAHVTEATKMWTEQNNAYSAQQDDYNSKIVAVQAELQAAQKAIQDLGMQAIETQQVKQEDQDISAALDLQQAQLSQKLATALQASTRMSEADAGISSVSGAPMEVHASDEEDAEARSKKERKRSLEPVPKASGVP